MTTHAGPGQTITTTVRRMPGKQATPKLSKQEQAIIEYAEKGAHTYADRRLLDITESVDRLRSMVQLMVVVMLLSILFGLIGFIAAAQA